MGLDKGPAPLGVGPYPTLLSLGSLVKVLLLVNDPSDPAPGMGGETVLDLGLSGILSPSGSPGVVLFTSNVAYSGSLSGWVGAAVRSRERACDA